MKSNHGNTALAGYSHSLRCVFMDRAAAQNPEIQDQDRTKAAALPAACHSVPRGC